MKTKIVARQFYEFHRTRNVARPGQPAKNIPAIEIGPLIQREDALRILKAGGYFGDRGDGLTISGEPTDDDS